MKKRFGSLIVAAVLIATFSIHAIAASPGYALFRDKEWPIPSNEHTGIVHSVNPYGSPSMVIHHPGSLDLEYIGLSTFINDLPYHGEYYHADYSQTVYNRVASLAKQMNDSYVYGYYLLDQLSVNCNLLTVIKIEPNHIDRMRCDGLVEYCYEYYGIPVLGPSDAWDISNPDHFNEHGALGDLYTPAEQRAALAATMS